MSSQALVIKEKLASLEEQLVANTPGIATLLREIHSTIKKDPDTATILSEEEVAILVKGLKKQTNTEIATKMTKKGATKALKNMTVADL